MIKHKLQADMIIAMKAHEQKKVVAIRYILSVIQKKEIDAQKELTDEESVTVLQKVNKELKESLEAFTKGNRTDLVQDTQAQIDIVAAYLPAQISDEVLEEQVAQLLNDNAVARAANPKTIIGIVMKALRSTAEPGRIMTALKKAGAL